MDPLEFDDGILLRLIECKNKSLLRSDSLQSDVCPVSGEKIAILLNGNLNHHHDIQALLLSLFPFIQRQSRVVAVIFNPYLRFLVRLANALGIRKGEMPTTFLTKADLSSIAKISGYEVVRLRNAAFSPVRFLGLGTLLNRFLTAVPLLRWLSFANVVVMRPVKPDREPPSLSVVIPARNEAGNIENAVKRIPDLNCELEIIFVEGHSTDNTWQEIERVSNEYRNRFNIKCLHQDGKGKCNAVRAGFAAASKDLLAVLDADLTMPPEKLPYFYNAYRTGKADFINGSRLLYPMQGQAMRTLNKIGNVFFARLLSWIMGQRITDSLCGTKLIRRDDYRRLCKWREDFGDFDPFGDFELLFFTASTGLGIVDVPIRYMDREYGTTNISRFRHGYMLFKMVLIGFIKLKIGAGDVRH
ncbi:MAG: glycosyltransferase family 2 protein [Kiritimatiellia bacterium]